MRSRTIQCTFVTVLVLADSVMIFVLLLQYFYDAHSQQYMYWDGTQYVPAQNYAPSTQPNIGAAAPEKDKEEKTKKEKGKMAKKVC